MTEPHPWENAMELVKGNDCVLDVSDNPRTQYMISNVDVMVGREPKMAAMTNSVSSSGGVPILLVSGSVMGTERHLMLYNHWVRVGVPMPIPQAQPYESENNICCYR